MNILYLVSLTLLLAAACSTQSGEISQEPEFRDELENFLKLYRAKQANQEEGSDSLANTDEQMMYSDDKNKDTDMNLSDFANELPAINEYLEAITLCTKLVDRIGFSVDKSVIALSAEEMKFEVCKVAILLYQLFTEDIDTQTITTTQPPIDIPLRSIDFRSLLLGQQKSKAQPDHRSIEPQKIGLRSFSRIGSGPLSLGK